MKLKVYGAENNEMLFGDGKILSIECQNIDYFSKLVACVKGVQNNEMALVENDYTLIPFEKCALTLIDYFSLDLQIKTLMTKFYKQVEKYHIEDEPLQRRITELARNINAIAEELVSDFNADFTYSAPCSVSELLKFADVKPQQSCELFADLLNFLIFISAMHIYRVIVLVNLKSYFSVSEVAEIYKMLSYYGQYVISIDNIITEKLHKNEQKLLIDEDLFDIIIE